MSDRRGTGPPPASKPTPIVVVRVPAGQWPGKDLAGALGAGFLVTTTDQILADVILLTDVNVTDVQNLRKRQPRIAIVVHTTPSEVVDMLTAGADVAVSTAPLAEVAARIRAVARNLPPRRPSPGPT